MIDTDEEILERIKAVSDARSDGNFNNSLPIAHVEIPNDILIKCPMERSTVHKASKCYLCNWFMGIVQTTWCNDKELSFDDKYAISCTFPIERKCSRLNGD